MLVPSKSDDDSVVQNFFRHEADVDFGLAETDEFSIRDADVEDVGADVQTLQGHHSPLGTVNLKQVCGSRPMERVGSAQAVGQPVREKSFAQKLRVQKQRHILKEISTDLS